MHDHIGEGGYAETEMAIQATLAERAARLGMSTDGIKQSVTTVKADDISAVQSPETYFGSDRNQYLGNGTKGQAGPQMFMLPSTVASANTLYLGGPWNIETEDAVTQGSASVKYVYSANDFYIVASGDSAMSVEVLQDGVSLTATNAGADVDPSTSTVTIQANRLYKLVHNSVPGAHTIELKISGPGFHAYTLDFG